MGWFFYRGSIKEILKPKPKYFVVKKVLGFSGSKTLGKMMAASDVVVAGHDELAVADVLSGQVLIFDFKGNLLRQWGKPGTGSLEFREPSGLAADHLGNLYVLDTWNGAVKVFDLKGKLARTLDLNHFGFFYGPRRIGWGGNCLLISDAVNGKLVRLSLDGALLGAWEGKNILKEVSSSIIDGKGHTLVGDSNAGQYRVQVFDETGKILRTIKTGGPIQDIALDSHERLFVGGYGSPSNVYGSDGEWLGYLVDEKQMEKPLDQIYGMYITPDNQLIACGGDEVSLYQIVGEKEK